MGSGSPSVTALGLPLGMEHEERKMNMVRGYEFDRLPRESVKAFAAFRAYLDLGPERSLAAVATKLGKSKVMMEKWSRKYDWMGRVAVHAGYVAQVEREAIECLAREKAIEWFKVHEEQRIAEWSARGRLLKLAERMITRWEGNERKCGTLEGIARLLELASKLGRLASGMEGDGAGMTKERAGVHVEVNLALNKIYGEPLPGEIIEVRDADCGVRSEGETEERRIGETASGGEQV